MQNIADFWNELLSNVPDVIVAVLVLILAFIVAGIAKGLTKKLLGWLGVEKLLAKVGVNKKHIVETKAFVAKVVQLAVFILFMPGVFEKLGMNAMSTPIVTMMNKMYAYAPNIVAAMLVLVIGLFLAKIVKELLLPVLGNLKINNWLAKIGVATKINVADVLATAAYVVVVVLFAVEAMNTLQFDILTQAGNAVIAYLPFAVSAFLMFGITLILAKFVQQAITNKLKGSKATAMVAYVGVVVIGTFMTLDQLGIANTTVNSAFVIVLGAVGVAFAIAFGVGGRGFAERQLKKLERRLDERKK